MIIINKKLYSYVLVISILLQIFLLCGCGKAEKFTDYSFDSFDTVMAITGFEKSKEVFDSNCEKIKEKLYYYHKLYDIYNKYDNVDNLRTINEQTGKISVSSDITELLNFSKDMYTKTNGRINIAMGSVLFIWHNYRQEGMNNPAIARLPDFSKLEEASNHIDINNLDINISDNTIERLDLDMRIDVGAVAKGYATQRVADWMAEQGMNGYILNVGGNVCTVGERADRKKWKIGIENPETENEDEPYIAYLELGGGKSLVTSGSYQRYYTVAGKQYHHIIDETTLMPAEYFKSVSVLCDDSGVADALSTALFCMNYEDGAKLISSFENTEAMWVTLDGKQYYSENFKDYFADK